MVSLRNGERRVGYRECALKGIIGSLLLFLLPPAVVQKLGSTAPIPPSGSKSKDSFSLPWTAAAEVENQTSSSFWFVSDISLRSGKLMKALPTAPAFYTNKGKNQICQHLGSFSESYKLNMFMVILLIPQ